MAYVIEKIKYIFSHDNLQIDVKWASISVGTLLLLYSANEIVKRRKLSIKRNRKRRERTHQLEELQRSLRSVDIGKALEITELTAEQIVSDLKNGKYSCQEVLKAFQCKAIESHNLTNCIVQPIKDAERIAVELENGDKSKVLYGLPVSLKDNYCYQGYDSTLGFSKWIEKPFQEDSIVVKVLKSQGAVPFVKTNVPQSTLSWDCTNPIFGATTNPLDENKGVGGSSGGEAALIASKGSVLGFGTDIGGSVRVPSAMCGTVALKPTYNRISSKGLFPLCLGQVTCPSCVGPMARDVDTLVLAMKALCVPLMWELDPSVPPLPFNEKVYQEKKPLKIGYYLNDGFIESVPAMQRGVLEAKTLLESMGHTVVEWQVPKDVLKEIVLVWTKTLFGDQGNEVLDILKDDAIDGALSTMVPLLKMPIVIKKFLSLLLRPLSPKVSEMFSAICGCRSVSEMWNVNAKTQELTSEILGSWKQNEFDAVICPGFACPAVPNGVAGQLIGPISYTLVYNTLNCAAGSMPVSTVNAEDEINMKNYPVCDPWHYILKKAMKNTVGLPVNVQVVTLPWQEELCLRIMKDIEIALKSSED